MPHSPDNNPGNSQPADQPGQPALEPSPAITETKQDLTTGSIPRHILKLAVPSLLVNALNFSYHFVDMMWLGKVGPQAIAVVTAYHFFFMVFVIFNQIVGLGSITLIARTYGAKDFEGCRRFIGQTFSFKLLIALIVMGLGLTFQRWMWTVFGSEPDVIALGLEYTTIMFAVIPIYFSAFTLRTSLTAIGDMRVLLIISAISTGLNIVLDPFLIFESLNLGFITLPGAGLGIAGAAWASFGAIFVLFALGQWYFMSGRTFVKVGVRDFFSWDWATVWRILKIGTPPAVGENLTSIGQVIVGRLINLYGTAIFAASGVMGMATGLIWVPVGGISQAVMTLVGQNLGAGKPERAERSVYSALGMSVVVLLVVVVSGWIWAEPLVRVFMPGSDEVSVEALMWGTRFLRISLLGMAAMGLSMVFGAAFWGSGDTKPPMYVQLITTYGIHLPAVYVCAVWLKLESPMFFVYAMAAAMAVGGLLTWLIFRRGKWKSVKV